MRWPGSQFPCPVSLSRSGAIRPPARPLACAAGSLDVSVVKLRSIQDSAGHRQAARSSAPKERTKHAPPVVPPGSQGADPGRPAVAACGLRSAACASTTLLRACLISPPRAHRILSFGMPSLRNCRAPFVGSLTPRATGPKATDPSWHPHRHSPLARYHVWPRCDRASARSSAHKHTRTEKAHRARCPPARHVASRSRPGRPGPAKHGQVSEPITATRELGQAIAFAWRA